MFYKPRGVACDLAIRERVLECSAKHILVAILRRRRALVGTEPRVNIRRFDIVRDAISKIFQNDVHSDPEALHVLSSMLDVSVNRFLGDDLKPKAPVFHIRREFHAPQSIVFLTLYNLIASPRRPTFSRRSRPSM
ncbi:MAG: hypothetical protein ABSA39_01430 [Edaphobacter sp.]